MADPKDELKTIKLNSEDLRETVEEAKAERAAAAETRVIPTTAVAEATRLAPADSRAEPPAHDGRFGERFDDELNVKSVLWVTASIAVVTIVFFVGSWVLYRWLAGLEEAAAPAPTPVMAENTERRLPSGPRLQRSPEEELVELRREMHERLHGYGWVDEAAGVVHIPIGKAIDLVTQNGLPPASETTAEPSGEEAGSP